MPDTITVTSRITRKNFRDFAIFDTLIRQKMLTSPLFFSGAFIIFALTCFFMRGRAEQAMLLCYVMLGIAIVVPGVYVGNFLYSVKKKADDLHLDAEGLHAYTVTMNDHGLSISNLLQKQPIVNLRWDQTAHAFRTKDCIYLYISARQAFLLPDNSADATPDELWAYLGKKMTAGKLTDRRKKK
jgi:hypothetical protein